MLEAKPQPTPRLAVFTPSVEEASLQALLEDLYRQQLSLDPGNHYFRIHGTPRFIANQIRTFHWYRPYLPESGTVLDWGCHHAPDSCLLRAWFGDRLILHGADFADPRRFRVFREFAGATYQQLRDVVTLPYASGSLDAVIGSGVLEHAAMDYESLKELWRILKPGGVLVITYLPNWLSFQEWRRRVVQKQGYHRRLYGVAETKHLLKHSGFYPEAARYHTFFWERVCERLGSGRWQSVLGKVAAGMLPFQVFSSTLCFVARKRPTM